MTFDPLQFKSQFPLFAQPENTDLVYLDNAATTQRPQAVIDAISHFYLHDNANTHRSSHRLARQATAMVERCREKAATFLGARQAQEIIFCRGATEALNLLAYSLGESLQAGDEIILSTAEHHANLVPWQRVAQRTGAVLRFIEDKQGVLDINQLNALLNDKTRILSITAASNALGVKTDVCGIKQLLAERNICWIVDAAQLAAHETIDVQTLGCDFLVCSAHKFFGPTGIGLLYGRQDLLSRLPPWQSGGEMITHVGLTQSEYAQAPHRFETGTSSLAAIAGLEAVLDWWEQQDRQAIQNYEQQLTRYLHTSLSALPSIRVLSPLIQNVGVVAFVPSDHSSMADMAHWLDEQDIAVRAGHHCAMPLMERVTAGGSLRASVTAYNTHADIDRLIAAITSQPAQMASSAVSDAQDIMPTDISHCDIDTLHQQRGWQKRYKLLLAWGEAVVTQPLMRTSQYLIQGCEAEAWLYHTQQGDRHYFAVDSDARVVKGLAVLLLVYIQGRTGAEIENLDLATELQTLGLSKHLSPSRNNGFRALMQAALEYTATP
jgi:SufS family cysteine desulfurase